MFFWKQYRPSNDTCHADHFVGAAVNLPKGLEFDGGAGRTDTLSIFGAGTSLLANSALKFHRTDRRERVWVVIMRQRNELKACCNSIMFTRPNLTGKSMQIQTRNIRIAALVLSAMAFGCGPNGAKPTPPSTAVSHIVESSSNQSNGTSLPKSDAMAANPPVVEKQDVAPKQKLAQPTADQLARWTQTEFEPLQLLAFRDCSKTGFVEKLAGLPDGKSFLLAGNQVTLWSLGAAEPEHVFLETTATNSGKELSIKSLAVAPNGKWFAAGDSDGFVRVWSLGDRKLVHSKKIFPTGITQIAISPDGQEVAMISYDVEVAVCLSSTLEKKNQFKINSNGLKNIEYVGLGQLAAAAETTTVWNTSTGKLEQTLSPGRYQSTLARTKDGKWFAFGEKDNLQFWDIAGSKKASHSFTNIAMNELVDFSPDGKSLITANGSNIRLWDFATQRIVQVIDVVGWPIVGLCWLPETNVILISTANGWTRIWGTANSGEPLGLRPIDPAIALPDSAAKEPASSEQWLQAIDLRCFPRLAGDKPMMVEPTRIDYTAHAAIDEAKMFYQYHLLRAGWTESSLPSAALSPGSIEYTKNGFMLTASFAGVGETKTNIGLHNIGNFDLRWLPKFDGAPITDGYSSANTVMYQTKADMLQIETTLLKKLHEAGWTAYSKLHTSHNEEVDVRYMDFLRNGTVLRISIRKFPADPTSFHIQESVSSVNHALPIPNDCGFIEFDGHIQPYLVATTSLSLDQALEFYNKSMNADGWLVHAAIRNDKEQQVWLTCRRGQQDVLVGLVGQPSGNTLVRVGDRLEDSSWQLLKPKPAKDTKSVGASIEAADFPILNASKSAKYDSNAMTIDVQVDKTPMTDVADRYSKELLALGWTIKGSGIRADDYTFLTFTKEKLEIAMRARPSEGNIIVNIQGDGLVWKKPLSGGKQIISYETWLRQNNHPATLKLLESYKTEMESIAK